MCRVGARTEGSVLVVLPYAAVEVPGAAFRNDIDRSAAGHALLGVEGVRHDVDVSIESAGGT